MAWWVWLITLIASGWLFAGMCLYWYEVIARINEGNAGELAELGFRIDGIGTVAEHLRMDDPATASYQFFGLIVVLPFMVITTGASLVLGFKNPFEKFFFDD